MKPLAPAAWIAIIVFVITVLSCGAMIYIAQSNPWSPATQAATESAEPSP